MDVNSTLVGRYLRIIALVALLLGLSDTARLLGVSSGAQSPIALLGPAGFSYLAVFCTAYLFAAVGLWLRASWGGVVLAIATAIELGLYLGGVSDIQIGPIGFAIRVVMLLSMLALFVLSFRSRRAAHD